MKTIIDFANKVKSLVDGRISNIANVEESPSTHAYAVGKQLIFNGLLCNATSAIAVGDTLAVGTNLALSDNVVEQIYSLNQGLTNSLNEIADMNNVLGAKNLLPNNAVSQTDGGVTFIVNSDGSISTSGVSTISTGNKHSRLMVYSGSVSEILGKTVALTGCPANGGSETYDLHIVCYDSSDTQLIQKWDYGTGATLTIPSNTAKILVYARCYYNVDVTGLTFYPMLRPASIQDNTYVPYSMTNREMTPYVQVISNPNLLDNPWFTVNQRGQNRYNANNAYTVDRWLIKSGDTTKNVTIDNAITLDSGFNGSFCQRIDNGLAANIMGKNVTLSVLLSDGSVVSSNITLPSTTPSGVLPIGNKQITGQWYERLCFYDNFWHVEVHTWGVAAQTSLSVKAIKLELGSVSTLAQDVVPNYAIELAKCRTSTADSSDTYANQGQINISKYDDDYWIIDSFGTNTSISYIRKNNVVTVSIAWWGTGSTIKNSDVIYTLPVKYRPGITIFTVNAYINQNSNIWIGSDGKINVDTNNQSGIIDYGRATISYIVV